MDNNSPAPSEPVFNCHYPDIDDREVSVPCHDQNENVGIGANNTIDTYLCIEDKNKNGNESKQEEIQTHNKYMFTNKSKKQFHFSHSTCHLFEYNDIFLSQTSFLSDIFSNVIQPLIHSFKNGEGGCLALYSPDKTAWDDRLQLFDVIHQILLQLNINDYNLMISAYQINDDGAYDLLPIKSTKYNNKNNILQFSRSKINGAPLKLSANRSLHYVLDNINKIGIKSIERGLQYFERSHNLFKSSKSSHYVYCITRCDCDDELRIVQLCTADPNRNQALLNMRQCIKVLKHNKTNQKKTFVPFKRHIFTKLFQQFIDGTSLFSFLFYLPPIHTHKIEQKSYLNRILSLLTYSCKKKQLLPNKSDKHKLEDKIEQLMKEIDELKQIKSKYDELKQIKAQDKENEIKIKKDKIIDEQTIQSLKRKFSVMCLKMDKVQIESSDYVQKAIALRDDNLKLKKQNKRHRRAIKGLESEIEKLQSKLINRGAVGVVTAGLNDIQINTIKTTKHRMNEINQRLNICVGKVSDLKMVQSTNKQKEKHIKDIILQITDLSDNVMDGIKHRLDETSTSFEMRCDGVSRNINHIKIALDNKQNEGNRIQITMEIFKNEMRQNIKHLIESYKEEYEQTQTMLSNIFELTIQRFNQSLNAKDSIIDQLQNQVLQQKQSNHKMNDEIGGLKQIESEYHDLKSVNEQLMKDINQLQLIKSKYDDLRSVNEQKQLQNHKDKHKMKEEIDELKQIKSSYDELRSVNEQLQNEICQQKQLIKDILSEKCKMKEQLIELKNERDKYYSDKEILQKEMRLVHTQLDELNESKTDLVAQIQQLMEFHINTAQLKEKIQQYSQMTACNQQRIKQLELMKNTLEKDNIIQLQKVNKMQNVFADNESKFKDLNKKYTQKVHELQTLQSTMNEMKSGINYKLEKLSIVIVKKLNSLTHIHNKYKHKLETEVYKTNYQLFKSQQDHAKSLILSMKDIDNEQSTDDCDLYCFMKQRIDDLKCECGHYKEMLRLNDIFNVKDVDLRKENHILTQTINEMKKKHRKEQIELKGLIDREVDLAHSQRESMEKELNVYRSKLQSFYKKHHRSTEQKEQQKLAEFMDNMRHEMTQISQENVTMATVTNSLREIVREHQDKTEKLETQNEEMYQDIRGLCHYMQKISGKTILRKDEENMYNASNLSTMVSIVKQRALSSLHQDINECPICEQHFNPMVWKYKCVDCDKHHCSLCAPIRKNYNDKAKSRVCHQCYQSND